MPYYQTDQSWSDHEARVARYVRWINECDRTATVRRRDLVEAQIVLIQERPAQKSNKQKVKDLLAQL